MSLHKVDTIFIIQGNGSWGVEGVCSSNCFCPGLLTHIKFGHWIEFHGVIQIFACLNSILLKVHILWGSVRYFRTQFAFFFPSKFYEVKLNFYMLLRVKVIRIFKVLIAWKKTWDGNFFSSLHVASNAQKSYFMPNVACSRLGTSSFNVMDSIKDFN